MKNKCIKEAKQGMLIYKVFCKECDIYHDQWKFPCEDNCENGKIPVNPLGYKLCDTCNGRGYSNKENK